MNFLNALTVITFCLTTILTIDKIIDLTSKTKTKIQSIYFAGDMIYLKLISNNTSSKPIAITNVVIRDSKSEYVYFANTYEKTIAGSSENKLNSNPIPINIPAYTAYSYFLSFNLNEWHTDLPSNLNEVVITSGNK